MRVNNPKKISILLRKNEIKDSIAVARLIELAAVNTDFLAKRGFADEQRTTRYLVISLYSVYESIYWHHTTQRHEG